MRNARPPDGICRDLHRHLGAEKAERIIDEWRRTATGSSSFPRVDPVPLSFGGATSTPPALTQPAEMAAPATHTCYQVKALSFLPAHSLAHGLKHAAAVRGLLWVLHEDMVAFQVSKAFTEDAVLQLVRIFLGDGPGCFELRALDEAAYEGVANAACIVMTASVQPGQS